MKLFWSIFSWPTFGICHCSKHHRSCLDSQLPWEFLSWISQFSSHPSFSLTGVFSSIMPKILVFFFYDSILRFFLSHFKYHLFSDDSWLYVLFPEIWSCISVIVKKKSTNLRLNSPTLNVKLLSPPSHPTVLSFWWWHHCFLSLLALENSFIL